MSLGRREKIGLSVLLAIVLMAGFYKLVVIPQHRQAAKLSSQIADERTAILGAQSTVDQARAARAEIIAGTPAYSAARRAVPVNANVPALIRTLHRAAVGAHVELVTIAFNGSGASGGGASAGGATETDGTTTVPVSLTFNGGYQALNRLVAALDRLVVVSGTHISGNGPLVGITNIVLGGQSQTGTGKGSGLSVQLTATIYQHGSATSVLGPTEGTS